jgi:SAM-dependent methyltransferase
VLDLGAGAGRHALELQTSGLEVTALDVSREAVDVMSKRGVRDARCGDLDTIEHEKFDTILLLMHGIGLVGTLRGLENFLLQVRRLLNPGGRIVCDSADLTIVLPALADPAPRAGPFASRYPGEVEFRLTYDGIEGQPYPWLFVDPRTLERFANDSGFEFSIACRGARGAFVAVLETEE